MTSDIVSVEIGRSTWQGPAEEAPRRAGPITMTYRNYRGEIAERRIIPEWVGFGATDWHPEPQWLLRAFDLDKNARRDFALADCQFADLCASGQQMRSLEWGAEAKFSGQPAIYADSEFGVRMIVDHAVHGNGIQAYDETGVSIGVYPDFKAAKAAAQADYERRILAALTPAPQPEGEDALKISPEYQALFDEVKQRAQPDIGKPMTPGQMRAAIMDGSLSADQAAAWDAPQPEGDHRSFPEAADGRPMPPMGDDLMIAGLNGEDARFVALQLAQNGLMLVSATPTAQEAVPDAYQWRYRTIGKTIGEWSGWDDGKAPSLLATSPMYELEERPLYAHPPQPSETVADTDAIAKAIAFSGEIKERRGWDDLLPETRKLYRDKATAALRALSGGEHG